MREFIAVFHLSDPTPDYNPCAMSVHLDREVLAGQECVESSGLDLATDQIMRPLTLFKQRRAT